MKLIKKYLPKTLKSKLLIAFFSIGFLPYLFILIYSHNLGEEKILENTLNMHYTQMHQVKEHIETQLTSLSKEIHFLASLDMMNDMIVEDIDKRITQLLIQKQKDLPSDTHLFTLDLNHKIVASSSVNSKQNFKYKHKFAKILQEDKKYFFTKKSIIMFSPINSTMQQNKRIGYVFIEYFFSNFKAFTIDKNGINSMLYNLDNNIKIGKNITYSNKNHLIIQEQFKGMLQKWSIVFLIQKSVILTFLDEFIFFIWTLLALGFIIIAIVSLWISKQILEPISQLSRTTKSIIYTKDYTTQVSVSAQGEIGELAKDFNAMVHETNQAFSILEKENKLRLLRFIQLTDIFNRLINAKSEEKCITIVIHELQTFMPHQNFSFSTIYPKETKEKDTSTYNMMLYVKDFDKLASDFYGVISLKMDPQGKDPYEEKFYRSIATMIMLQLNQIRLIDRTQEVSRAKSTFISLMSHELRTPLHMILSSAQYLIGYENLSQEQQEKIATMESSAHHLLDMINDILDLAQIEAGKVLAVPIEQSSEEVEEQIKSIINMLEVLAEQKNIAITLENKLLKSISVSVDIRLLKQIIINLLSNAIKFTQEGSIKFTLKTYQNDFYIEIKDSGIGISNENISHLFEDFTQINNRSINRQKSNGLGLAISRKLAYLFNAKVNLISDGEGFGTTAIITLNLNH